MQFERVYLGVRREDTVADAWMLQRDPGLFSPGQRICHPVFSVCREVVGPALRVTGLDTLVVDERAQVVRSAG